MQVANINSPLTCWQTQQRKLGEDDMQTIPVYQADSFKVVHGANLGDTMSFADELMLDDVYTLKKVSPRRKLPAILSDNGLNVGTNGDVGSAGNALYLDSCVTLMTQNAETVEALLIVEVATDNSVENVYVMPFAPMIEGIEYTLVGINRQNAEERFAQITCVSFVKGTRITLLSGALKPIEDLNIGEQIITRDKGVQEIRWIGQSIMRATGDFAPVVIKAGAMNNMHDLVVSPEHRLFVYQRQDKLGTGRAETLVRAKHLVNGNDVYRLDDGFVEYYQLLFDDHQIIYAEGIAAESLLFDQRTQSALPSEAKRGISLHRSSYRDVLEVDEDKLRSINAVHLLRQASRG